MAAGSRSLLSRCLGAGEKGVMTVANFLNFGVKMGEEQRMTFFFKDVRESSSLNSKVG